MMTEKEPRASALTPQSISSTGSTGYYFNLKSYVKAGFTWTVACTGLTATSTGLIYQATDENGTSAAAITTTSTVAYGTSHLTLVTVTPSISAGVTGATIEINGLTFTGVSGAATATTSNREFVGNTANVSTTCTNLAGIVNDADYGVPGVYGSASSTNVTLRFAESGTPPSATYVGIVCTSSSTTDLTIAGVCMEGHIDVQAQHLTLTSSFTHVAINVINTAAYYTAATIVREGARYRVADQMQPDTAV